MADDERGAVRTRPTGQRPPAAPHPRGAARAAVPVALVTACLLVAAMAWDLSIGPYRLSAPDALRALFGSGRGLSVEIVRTIRLPRVVMAATVGFAMAVAGVVMQGATGNPLGAPDIVGVSAGATLVVVAAATVFANVGGTPLVLLAIAGAAAAGLVVVVTANLRQGRSDPVRLALAGVTVSYLLLALTQTLLLFHQNGLAGVFFWLVGGVNYAQWSELTLIAPWLAAGVAGAMLLAVPLNVLALGDETARALGLNVNRIRLLAVACVVALAGAAVAVAGPIGFVGLIVPHTARRLVGPNNVAVIPVSGLIGAALLVWADVASRYVQYPYETPTGVITALIGAPFFLYLARRRRIRP
jgi:ferric citrate transport system permease protein